MLTSKFWHLAPLGTCNNIQLLPIDKVLLVNKQCCRCKYQVLIEIQFLAQGDVASVSIMCGIFICSDASPWVVPTTIFL